MRIPCDEIAYASNDRSYDTISIECCHTEESGEFTDATYQSLVALVAWLVCEYDLEVTDVVRHYDVTENICPKYYVEDPEAWEEFLNDVEKTTDYADIDCSDILDAIIYNGERYCGLGMKWSLEELPDDFELIGQFSGALTDDNEELSSTMIFHDNDNIYYYVDEPHEITY